MKQTVKFHIPKKVSSNEIYSGMHWTKRKRIKDLFRKVHFVTKAIDNYPVKCHYHFQLSGKMLDISNHFFLVKLIEDSLVYKGILQDDSIKYVSEITVTAEKGDDVCLITIAD